MGGAIGVESTLGEGKYVLDRVEVCKMIRELLNNTANTSEKVFVISDILIT